ncbi:MAG TPA: nucleotidyltransferase, partial [Firmicutes bacterium]|nr:nucleotidyltransferase [Bacillota bacterium]
TEKLIGDSSFIVISGDVITDFNLTKAVKFHKDRKSLITIVLTRVKNPLEYGVVIIDKENQITKFLEKPSWGEVFSDTINTGIYIIEPAIMKYIPENQEFDFSKNLFPTLMKNNIPIYGYVAEGYWKDVGNIGEYRKSHMDILSGDIDLNIPGTKVDRIGRDIRVGENTVIHETSRLKTSVIIGNNCEIAEDVQVIDSIIGNNVRIGPGSIIRNSIIWDNVKIGSQVHLTEDIILNDVIISDKSYILEEAVISDRVSIGMNSTVKAGVKIWPEKIIEAGSIVDKSMVWGDRWSSKLFGAYGVTGIANVEITPEFAAKLGAAYGAYLGRGSTVLISRDIHRASRMISRAFVTGLISLGVNISDLQNIPLPVMRYQLGKWSEKGGVHIRRSPFDPQLIDLKFFGENGLDLSTSNESAIERLFFREDFRRARYNETGNIQYPYRVLENYKEGFLNEVDEDSIKERKLKIVIDYSFGLATQIFPSILGKLGCDAISLNAYLDEEKLTRTESEFYAALHRMSNIVRTTGGDIGILIDAGSEKVFVSDEKGNIISGDDILALFIFLLAKVTDLKKVLVPISASRRIDIMAKNNSFQVIRSKFNTRFMSLHAVQENADFVGETKGGFMFPKFMPAFDGLMSIVKLLEMLSKYNKHMSVILKEIPDSSFMVRDHIFCPWERKGEVMRKVLESEKSGKVELIDGIKIFNKNDWVFIIPDGEKALFHINAEATTEDSARKLVDKYIKLVSKIRDE